jgi:hypothetical protein
MKKIRDIVKNILIIFSLAQGVFPYTLLFYLVLFLLENLLPGFVSNNFSLNWILVAVLVLGFLAAFAPENKEIEPENTVGRNDYLLVAVLGIVGGAIIYAKLDMDWVLRWVTSLISGALIMLVGFVTLTGEDEPTENFEEVTQGHRGYNEVPAFHRSHLLRKPKHIVQQLLIRHVKLLFACVLLFSLCAAFLIPKNITTLSNALRRSVFAPVGGTPSPTPKPEPFYWDDVNQWNNFSPSGDIHISVLNGGSGQGSAASVSSMLRSAGFADVTAGDAKRYDYTNVTIIFRPEDKPQSSIIKRLLEQDYPQIQESPANASANGITVILGKKEAK